jgi:hypothetical protein
MQQAGWQDSSTGFAYLTEWRDGPRQGAEAVATSPQDTSGRITLGDEGRRKNVPRFSGSGVHSRPSRWPRCVQQVGSLGRGS